MPSIEPEPEIIDDGLRKGLAGRGFLHLSASAFRNWIDLEDQIEFEGFASSWEELGPDLYMADGGRYRRRRYAAFALSTDHIRRLTHRPHFQSRDYNRLNGDIQRWFEPVADEIATSRIIRTLATGLTAVFTSLEGQGRDQNWLCELHQIRIEAANDVPGLPTPEGLHRDGVDWVLVMLVRRHNVKAGTTQIRDERGGGGDFTLREPGEAVLLNDRRIRHGVTPITPLDPRQSAFRDVLVMTWKKLV